MIAKKVVQSRWCGFDSWSGHGCTTVWQIVHNLDTV